MGRQLFLHHYLPAHLASVLVAGALVEFIFNLDPVHTPPTTTTTIETTESDDSSGKSKPTTTTTGVHRFVTSRERMGRQSVLAVWLACLALLVAVFWGFCFYAPVTYGTPGLSAEAVNARKWLDYDMHFAK